MATAPGTPAATRRGRTIHLSDLLKRPITDSRGESLGRVEDVVVSLPGNPLPVVKGLVTKVGGREVFVPVEQTGVFDGEELKLTSPKLDLRRFERRDGEVLLRRDVLGHRLIDVPSAHLIRANDLELRQQWIPDGREEWVLAGVDTRRRPGLLGRLTGRGGGDQDGQVFRDWSRFEPLIGHAGSAGLRGPLARIRRLKPAQIADLLEDASRDEESEILGHVHVDPELEADVFEELDEDQATRLLAGRSDAEIADVLARMRADDAADAVAELPQPRRRAVLDLLPPGQRTKVLTLMGFNPTSAGGLMGVDFLMLPQEATAGDALSELSRAQSLQPEALTSVHAVDADRRLSGVTTVVRLVQSDPATPLLDVCDRDPVRIGADTDVVDVAVLMSDYNLITVPVVDDDRRMIGLITVDDVLEATLPDDWRRRETAQPPDAHRGAPK